jgi:alpha-1,6-mannosyltransferase
LVAVAVGGASTLVPNVSAHPRVGLYFGAVGAAFVGYLVGLVLLRRRVVALWLVLALAVLIQAVPLTGPLLLSQDATAYWDYGRIAAIDEGNPYQQPPSRFPSDPAFASVSGVWRGTTSAYGPLFTVASEGQALVAGSSASTATMLFRIAATVGALVLATLAAAVSERKAFAAAAVGWNPLIAVHFAGGGHNDVWMMVPLLGALVLDARGRRQLAGCLWAVAAAVKWIPLLLLPIRVAERRREARFGYQGFLVAGMAGALLATALYKSAWLRAFAPVAHDLRSGSKTSIAHLVGGGTGISHHTATLLLATGFGIAYLMLLASARRGRVRLGLAAGFLLLATPWILPWYLSWTLPLAAAEDDTAALGISVLLSGYLLEARAPL